MYVERESSQPSTTEKEIDPPPSATNEPQDFATIAPVGEIDLLTLEGQLFDQSLYRLWRTGAVEEQYLAEEDGDVDVSFFLHRLQVN